MARYPERLPGALSERLAGAGAAIYSRLGREVDVAIGGVPFLLATSQELPQSIETISVRKDQLDVERDPGEQSLSGWWRRSQASFHEGAGLVYQESGDNNEPSNGFHSSKNVIVTTKGEITPEVGFQKGLAETGTLSLKTRIRSCNVMIYDGKLTYLALSGVPTTIHAPSGKTVVDGWRSADTHFWSITTDGTLYAGLISSPGTATSWPLGTTLSANAQLMWAKDRIWIIDGRSIWQPDLALAAGTTQAPIYTSPNPAFAYSSMASSPGPVLFAGDDGSRGVIQAITLDVDGALPTLSGATVIAEFPPFEVGVKIATLAGQYVGIGTTAGFRVGRLDGDRLVYGPLHEIDNPCTAVAVMSRYFLVAFSGDSPGAVWRVDTGTEVADGVFAYSHYLQTTDNLPIISLTQSGAIDSGGSAWFREAGGVADESWLQTGRIRFRTTELKAFKYLNLEGPPLEGTITVDAITPDGSTHALGAFTEQGVVPDAPLDLSDIPPCKYISLRFTFGTTGPNQNPTINSYLLRALPVVVPQRLITLPLMCFDKEVAKSGQKYGADGYAKDRLAALHELERNGDTLVYQDFASGDTTGQRVVIESVRFVQTSPPTPTGSDRSGGIIILQLRTVEAS